MSVGHPTSRNAPTPPKKATRRADYTGDTADRRVLRINLGIIRYGTDDKTHGAAVVFSLLLFAAICVIMVFGMITSDREWADKVLQWLGSAFLFVLGVAIGRSGNSRT